MCTLCTVHYAPCTIYRMSTVNGMVYGAFSTRGETYKKNEKIFS